MKPALSKSIVLAVTLLSVLASLPASAERTYYRWLDDRGDPVHSDRPPPAGVDYEVVSTETTMIRRVPGEEGAVPAETTPRVGNEFDAVDATKEHMEVIKKNPEYCKRAQENLETLNSAAKIRIRDEENGEYRTLNAEEIEAQRTKAKDTMAVHCK